MYHHTNIPGAAGEPEELLRELVGQGGEGRSRTAGGTILRQRLCGERGWNARFTTTPQRLHPAGGVILWYTIVTVAACLAVMLLSCGFLAHAGAPDRQAGPEDGAGGAGRSGGEHPLGLEGRDRPADQRLWAHAAAGERADRPGVHQPDHPEGRGAEKPAKPDQPALFVQHPVADQLEGH